jgi:hypothetical protein
MNILGILLIFKLHYAYTNILATKTKTTTTKKEDKLDFEIL